MDLDNLYYSDQQVQKNIEIRSRIPDIKWQRAKEERDCKMYWLLNHGIPKKEIEQVYWKFSKYEYYGH